MTNTPGPITVAADEKAPLLIAADNNSTPGTPTAHSAEGSCRKILSATIQRFTSPPQSPLAIAKPSVKRYPSVADIPITSAARLAQAAVDSTSDGFTTTMTTIDSNDDYYYVDDPSSTTSPVVPRTYLYLAYGSNLSAETFLGRRGIRPLSRINVSAPAFDLNFGLPGLPYWEPCFANVEPRRKIPQPPPPPPPGRPPVPRPPPIDPSPAPPPVNPGPPAPQLPQLPSLPPRDGPEWNKGLYGVVYEVTAEDYATIVKTEGGGASYKDVVTPCVPLPPPMHVPEMPLVPELPRPFLAHTLYAPRIPLPNPPPPGGADDQASHDDDDDDDKPKIPKSWLRRLLLPVQRPPDYAQPSLRYLTLLRDGARENYLPDDYQVYLAELHAYTITTRRQTFGRLLYAALWFPWLFLVMAASRVLADRDTGRVPAWLGAATTVLVNIMWISYDDWGFKKWFGDGERTEPDDGDGDSDGAGVMTGKDEKSKKWNIWSGYARGEDRSRRRSFVLPGQGAVLVRDEEKNRLLDDW